MRAISVRQPYAWAIIHVGKDVENRSQRAAFQFKPAIGARLPIHASKGMTADEYAVAIAFMTKLGVPHPKREGLQFGGVIGSVFVRDIVSGSDSPWYQKGATALVFADPKPEPFMPVHGQTGLFWVRSPCIAISIEAFEAIARTPARQLGYESKTDEEGERLIVMVGVGLGYIVTDAI